MSKDRLLSDEELRREVVQKVARMVADGMKGGAFMDWTVGNEIADLFNTQKRLYAESVIGEDDNRDFSGNDYSHILYEKQRFKNELRAEQRAKLTTNKSKEK